MLTNRWLFLDDLRNPPHKDFYVARTVEDAIVACEQFNMRSDGKFIISLDHDLGGEDGSYLKTGYDFCKWLIEECYYDPHFFPPSEIYLHTANPVGRDNMYQLLKHNMPSMTKIYRSPVSFMEGNY